MEELKLKRIKIPIIDRLLRPPIAVAFNQATVKSRGSMKDYKSESTLDDDEYSLCESEDTWELVDCRSL